MGREELRITGPRPAPGMPMAPTARQLTCRAKRPPPACTSLPALQLAPMICLRCLFANAWEVLAGPSLLCPSAMIAAQGPSLGMTAGFSVHPWALAMPRSSLLIGSAKLRREGTRVIQAAAPSRPTSFQKAPAIDVRKGLELYALSKVPSAAELSIKIRQSAPCMRSLNVQTRNKGPSDSASLMRCCLECGSHYWTCWHLALARKK